MTLDSASNKFTLSVKYTLQRSMIELTVFCTDAESLLVDDVGFIVIPPRYRFVHWNENFLIVHFARHLRYQTFGTQICPQVSEWKRVKLR